MDAHASFALLCGAFPQRAEVPGASLTYAAKNGAVLIETRLTSRPPDETCRCCGQPVGHKTRRFLYWLLVNGKFQLVDSSRDTSKLAPMRTITDSLRPLA